MATTATVFLGGRVFPVVPQKHARLRHHLSMQDFQTLMSRDYGHHAYRLLCILIPALETYPEYEFEGFHNDEDYKAYMEGDRSRYNEDDDPSPTSDQIVEAFETALKVSGAGRLGKLMTLLQATTQAATLGRETQLSPASPGSNGESPSTTTGMSPQTPTENAA